MNLTWEADGLKSLGEQLRTNALQNFDRSGIQNRSGTLRAAIEGAQIGVEVQGAGFTVTVTLDDRVRPARGGEANPPSTRAYGPRVFSGRPSLIMRGSGPVVYRSNLRVSRPSLQAGRREVFTLTTEKWQNATETASALLVEAVEKALAAITK